MNIEIVETNSTPVVVLAALTIVISLSCIFFLGKIQKLILMAGVLCAFTALVVMLITIGSFNDQKDDRASAFASVAEDLYGVTMNIADARNLIDSYDRASDLTVYSSKPMFISRDNVPVEVRLIIIDGESKLVYSGDMDAPVELERR